MALGKWLNIGVGVLLASTSITAEGEWPRFRGPNADGKSSETGLLKKWPAGGPKRLWTARGCGIGYSSVSIGNGLIYTMGAIENEIMTVAFDLNGKRKWAKAIGPASHDRYATRQYKKFLGSRSTPTIDGKRLYVESPLGDVACLDALTGNKIWSVHMIEKFGGRNTTWAFSESPLVDGGNVICCPGGVNAGVVALNKNTGDTVWVCKESKDKPGYACPLLVEYGGLRQIITMTAKAVIGVKADTGELLWRHQHETSWDANIPTPIFHDGHVFISSGYKKGSELLRLKVSGKRVSTEKVWECKALDNHHGGVVLVGGYLYGADSKRNWICVDFKTGRVVYRAPGVGKGSVTYADGMLYCLAERRGTVGLVKATSEGHRVVGRFTVPNAKNQVWAHPVICGGRLYIRYKDALHAYDVKAK